MLGNRYEYEIMRKTEDALWWYRVLFYRISSVIQKQFDNRDIKILDAGCGTGGLIRYLDRMGYKNLQGFDLEPIAVEIAGESGYPIQQFGIEEGPDQYKDQSFDVIVSSDVLYFVPEEKWLTLLNNYSEILSKHGIIILNLPAGSEFKGSHDTAVGIQKRIHVKKFMAMIKKSKLQPVLKQRWPLLLAPIIFIVRFFQRNKRNTDSMRNAQSDLKEENMFLNKIFKSILILEYHLLPFSIWGSSLFLVLTKK